MPSSNRCFLTCIQISQETGRVVWYSHLSKNFPQFVVIHTVKRFGKVNKAEMDVFLELSGFFNDPTDVDTTVSSQQMTGKMIMINMTTDSTGKCTDRCQMFELKFQLCNLLAV